MNDDRAPGTYGFITPSILWIVRCMCISTHLKGYFGRGALSADEKIADGAAAHSDAKITDLIMTIRLVAGALLFFLVGCLSSHQSDWRFCGLIAVLLICDMFGHVVLVAIHQSEQDFVGCRRLATDTARVIVLGGLNYCELILYFAVIYTTSVAGLTNASSCWDSMYFSVVTQTTVGYGEIQPLGWLRLAVSVQALMGFAVLILLISQFVNALPQTIDLTQLRREKRDAHPGLPK